ncbi:hypothetical protein QFC22_006241 [Naganishia vaughanmartiniae]|uniref:Uncharacterized protein n=1 Tax=Naganishia vaughanmartiniae TaxID=1424756 RepID=A0ACC2WNL0_9TREE|nr:hypothetical protein QFC22_006241 [Naganishia vaughanmartiniae]
MCYWPDPIWLPSCGVPLAGAWISEFNMGCHMVLRGLEIVARNQKDNGYPQFERQSWLIAPYYAKKWSAQDFRIEVTNPNSLKSVQHLYRQLEALLIFISAQTTKINARKVKWRKSVASLPWGWRRRGMIYGVNNDLRIEFKRVDAKLLELEKLAFGKRRVAKEKETAEKEKQSLERKKKSLVNAKKAGEKVGKQAVKKTVGRVMKGLASKRVLSSSLEG